MKISILGGGGFLGRKIAEALAATGRIGAREVTSLTLFDLAAPASLPARLPGPMRSPATLLHCRQTRRSPPAPTSSFTSQPWSVQRRRRITISAGASICAATTRWWMPAAASRRPPRVVFTSSVASFAGGQGARLAGRRQADAHQFLRRAEGRSRADPRRCQPAGLPRCRSASACPPSASARAPPTRLPAASCRRSFASRCLGLATTLPVPEDFAVWIASPAHAVAMAAPRRHDGHVPCSAAIAASTRPASASPPAPCWTRWSRCARAAAPLVTPVPDANVAAIVGGWPAAFAPQPAPRRSGLRSAWRSRGAHRGIHRPRPRLHEGDARAVAAKFGRGPSVKRLHFNHATKIHTIPRRNARAPAMICSSLRFTLQCTRCTS